MPSPAGPHPGSAHCLSPSTGLSPCLNGLGTHPALSVWWPEACHIQGGVWGSCGELPECPAPKGHSMANRQAGRGLEQGQGPRGVQLALGDQ